MNQKLFNVLMFATGAAIGSLVTWKVVKTKYEKILQEEIDSVKETWADMAREKSAEYDSWEDDCEDDDEEDDPDDEALDEYHELTNLYHNGGEGGGDSEVPYVNGPCVITPEDFGDGNYDHTCYSLTYYSDGVLANDWDEVFDVEDTIGEESLKHFGDYTEDIVHVRNERLNADYEVVLDPRKYADVLAENAPVAKYAD